MSLLMFVFYCLHVFLSLNINFQSDNEILNIRVSGDGGVLGAANPSGAR